MAKKKITKDYYRLDNIMSHPAAYYMIIGERSNGKTYSVKEYMLKKRKGNPNGKFLYVRRRHTHITRFKMYKLFNDMQNVVIDLFGDEMNYTTDAGFFVNIDGVPECVGYCTSIEDSINVKGIPFNEISTIFFDEFIDYAYMDNEIDKFLHLISTVVRDRTDVEIFMCANTISRFCPYFEVFKIEPQKLQQGKVHFIKFNAGASIAIEYCKTRIATGGKEKKHKYLGLDDNETVKMILYGEFDRQVKEIHGIDGIGWSSRRRKIPAYITALGEVYELSIKEGNLPILFVRKVNTQNGMVKQDIMYNISIDGSVSLTNKKGIVPYFAKVSNFFDEATKQLLTISRECVRCGRVVYDNYMTGTEFETVFSKI